MEGLSCPAKQAKEGGPCDNRQKNRQDIKSLSEISHPGNNVKDICGEGEDVIIHEEQMRLGTKAEISDMKIEH